MEYDDVIQRLVQDYVEGCGYGLFLTTVGKTKCILH